MKEILAEPGAPCCRQAAGRDLGWLGTHRGEGDLGSRKDLYPLVPPL